MNGIGGRTIQEAKERMSYVEAMQWIAFINRRGTLNLGMRVELLIAQLCMVTCQANGMKKKDGSQYTLEDFVLHADKHEMTEDEITKALGGLM